MDISNEIKKLESEYTKNPTLEGLSKLRDIMAVAQDANKASFKKLLIQLYPDNAHFIYELLQNAQDASKSNTQPGVVRFILTNEELVFEHNGSKLFDIKDVDAITGISVSTKLDDTTNIGKFGVGFKSVFAITDRPQIQSGGYNFAIERLFVPIFIDSSQVNISQNYTTRFIFPFNNPKKAVKDIGSELKRLGSESVLFIKNINEIKYLLPEGNNHGSIKRTTDKNGITKIEIDTNEGKRINYWLKYDKDISVENESGEIVNCTISIAFKVEKETKKDNINQWKIVPAKPGKTFICFPAEKETSKLLFHINAPFASTVARDSIRDCEENNRLRDALSELIIEAIEDIKHRNLLTVEFLKVLPIEQDNLTPFYEVIRIRIIDAFQKTALLPTKSGHHAPSDSLYRGPARISEVIDDDDLSLLTGYTTPLWVKNPQQQQSHEYKFIESLNIDEWGYRELAYALSPDDEDKKDDIENWIAHKPDNWLMLLYSLLYRLYNDEWLDIDKSLNIVRTTNNAHVKGEDAFFQPKNDMSFPDNLFFVKPEVYDIGKATERKNTARGFLEEIGVKEYDETEEFRLKAKNVADKYTTSDINISPNQHLDDIVTLLMYDDSKKLLDGKYIALSEDGRYYSPKKVCTPAIYGLLADAGLKNEYEKKCISNIYEQLSDEQYNSVISLFCNMGAMDKLIVEEIRDYYRIDYTIFGIEEIINILAKSKNRIAYSKIIWDAVIGCNLWNIDCIRTRPDGRYNFSYSNTPSKIYKVLSSRQWVSDKNGNLYKPTDITENMLPEGFTKKDSYLFRALNFGENARKIKEQEALIQEEKNQELQQNKEFAAKWGLDLDYLQASKRAVEEGIDVSKLINDAIEQAKMKEITLFPEHSVKNTERRTEKVKQDYNSASTKQYQSKIRSVRTSTPNYDERTMLYQYYTNEDKKMVCQMCKEEMPFKKRDGQYYFEAVEAFEIGKESVENHLALCPLCAAKYKEFIKHDKYAQSSLAEDFLNSDKCEITVMLDCEESIKFVETHMFDLKIILNENNS